jgi:hypothetical protein
MIALWKKMTGNRNERSRNVDWNGILCDREQVRRESIEMVTWFPTINLSNFPK